MNQKFRINQNNISRMAAAATYSKAGEGWASLNPNVYAS